MKKIFNKIHLWLSIPLGLIITIICFSGAMLVFQTEINELTKPNLYFVKEKGDSPLPIDSIVVKVNSQLTDRTVTSVQVPSDPERNYVVGLAGEGRASGYVNPYTGELMGMAKRGDGGFFSVMLQLHRWLLSREIGKPIVGYTTLFFVFILITGIIIWWPKNRKQLKHRLQIKTKNGWERFWFDLHITGGMYLTIGLLVLALTGLTYSFRWYSNGFYKLLGVEITQQGRGQQGGDNRRPEGGQEISRGEERNNRSNITNNTNNTSEPSTKNKVSPEEQNNHPERGNKPNREKRVSKDEAQVRDYKPEQISSIVSDSSSVSNEIRSEHVDRVKYEGRVDRGTGPERGDRQNRRNKSRQDSISQYSGKADLADNTDLNIKPERQRRIKENNSELIDTKQTIENPRDSVIVKDVDVKQKEIDMSQWATVLAELKSLNPEFKTISIQNGTASVVQEFTFGNVRAADKYTFDSQSGEITNVQLYKDQDRAGKVRGWIYSLHVGAWGGLFSKIITCIVALVGASLPLTGYYMFFIKRRKKKKN